MNRIESALYMVSNLPWPLLLAIQISIVGMVASLVVRFGLPRNPLWANRILFLSSIGLLGLPLLHLSGVPTVAIETDLSNRTIESSSSARANSQLNVVKLIDDLPDLQSQTTHAKEPSSNKVLESLEGLTDSSIPSEDAMDKSDLAMATRNSTALGNSDLLMISGEGFWRLGITVAYGLGCNGQ